MAKTKKKTDGKTSQVSQRDSWETHQVPDNPSPYPIQDSIENWNLTLPDLRHSIWKQTTANNTIGNSDSSDQVWAEFQITSEDCEGNTQTNHEEDYESIRKSSDLTPLEGSGNRWENTTPSKQDIPGVSALWESEAKINKELSEQRSIQVKKLEQELYLAAERLREAQDEELEHNNPCAQSRPSDQFGLTIEDKNIIQAMQRLHFFCFFIRFIVLQDYILGTPPLSWPLKVANV